MVRLILKGYNSPELFSRLCSFNSISTVIAYVEVAVYTCVFVDVVQTILKLLMTGRDDPRSGVMIPVPQYPLYTATIAEYNAYPVSVLGIVSCQRVR